ncbi:hypothetical protein BU16DRAFT_293627 [Lophium mytilinum]|uniref:Uncharacterized protein n=1 Tax=Lophium mytilinum TaxID=390894 RepID=A0A6A6R139_9PEZI|nr:hypothetical protein BU16DRAFT_293627 [Lophium mytilinum]
MWQGAHSSSSGMSARQSRPGLLSFSLPGVRGRPPYLLSSPKPFREGCCGSALGLRCAPVRWPMARLGSSKMQDSALRNAPLPAPPDPRCAAGLRTVVRGASRPPYLGCG